VGKMPHAIQRLNFEVSDLVSSDFFRLPSTLIDAFQNASVLVSDDIVVQDGNIVTSQGPGTALEFSLFLVELIYGKETAETLANQMIYERKIRPSTLPIDP
jgi:transcriptional regulator GlxA family with amidase domain